MNKTTFTVGDDKKTLTMERTFQAPQNKLWRAYSEKELFEQWFAPQGWEVRSDKFDFKEGGENVYLMTCVDKAQGEWYGQTSAGKMVFSDIDPEATFTYADYFTDEAGVVNESMPVSISKLHLRENEDGSTTLRIVTSYDSEADLSQVLEMGMKEGYAQTLDKLEELVAQTE